MSFQTKQKNDKTKWKRLTGWILALLLLFALVVLVKLQIKDIRVTGNQAYDAETLTAEILPEGWDRNPLIAVIKDRFVQHKTIPFISSYELHLTGPESCEIIVYEKAPLGYIEYMSSYMYFDKDGMIIESSDKRMEDIPEITGLKFGNIILGQKLKADSTHIYEEIMSITQQLSTYGIPCKKIDFDDKRNATLYLEDGKIRVKIGNDENLPAKLAAIGDIIGEIQGRELKGTVDLSNYSDRSEGGFIFVPDT